MVNQLYPSVNEHACSWADIAATFNVVDGATLALVDITAIKWSAKVEVGEFRGASGGRVLKRTAGSESVEASATVSRAGMITIVEALETAAVAAQQTRGDQVIISGVSFDILVQHTPLGTDRIYTTKLVGCRYLGDSDDMKEGNEADLIELTLNPIQILRKSATGAWVTLR